MEERNERKNPPGLFWLGLDIILELIFATLSTLWTLSFSDLRFYERVQTVVTL